MYLSLSWSNGFNLESKPFESFLGTFDTDARMSHICLTFTRNTSNIIVKIKAAHLCMNLLHSYAATMIFAVVF